jgi:crossover junction endodeoxyribonuclease RuvC
VFRKGFEMKTILGIDNGLGGSLCFYNGEECMIYDMPTLEVKNRNVLDMQAIARLLKQDPPWHTYIEKLTPMPKVSGLSGFSMGHSEGFILGLLTGFNLPYTLIRPNNWKAIMQCPADKDGARQRASQLLPQFAHNWPLKKHDGRAESALIALYGWGRG